MGAWFRWLRAITAATVNLFTISGGRILVTQILGEITTVIQVLATNVYLQANPTTGTTRGMCAALNISGYAEGDLLGITGVNTDPMIPPASSGVIEGQTFGVIVQEGTIDLVSDAAPTGSVKWTLKWVPIDTGAAVVAA